MFFVASATIASEHPELADDVRAVDEHIFRHAGHPLRADFTAELLGIERGRLARLMGLFADKGVVKKLAGYVCPRCDGLMEHVPGEGDLWCGECEESVSLRGRGDLGVAMWETLPGAAVTGESLAEDASEPAACPTEKVCIQFVSGDRGGAGRPLVMIHREDKAIRDAISLGKFRDAFTFADSVHAASIDDLINCSRAKPSVMHLAGHGDERELILIKDRDLIVQQSTLDLGQVVEMFWAWPHRVRLVFFNTCHSAELAKGLAESGAVDLAIGVPGRIGDDPAIDVAKTFYRQLSEGLSVRRSFALALLQIKNVSGAVRHELFNAPGVDPEGVSFGR
jgi:CHAT domain